MIDKLKEYLKTHKYFLFLLIFFVIMLPLTISMPAQTDTRAIVTGISIDKKDDNFNIGLQLISPKSNISSNENLQIVEDDGSSLYNCISNLSIKLGKIIGFEHANIIILGEGIIGEDVMNILDYLYRNHKITMSAIVLQCKGKAKDLLESSAELNNNSSSSLQNNLGFNNNIVETASATTLGAFFNDYFSFSGTSLISVIETPDKNENNQDASSGGDSSGGGTSQESGQGGSGGGGSSQGSTVEPLVKNNGEGAVYKNGKFIEIISKDLTKGFSWAKEHANKGFVKVENITDKKYYNNSTVTIKVENTQTKIQSRVNKNELIMNVKLNIFCNVAEILDNTKKSPKIVELNENYLTPTLCEKIKEKISNLVEDSLNYSKEKNLDVFKFYDRFYKHNNKEFKKVLEKYGEDYLKQCRINMEIEVYQYK